MDKVIVPEIETERLLLRQVTPDDLDEFARLIFANPDVTRYLPRRDMTPRERADASRTSRADKWQTLPHDCIRARRQCNRAKRTD